MDEGGAVARVPASPGHGFSRRIMRKGGGAPPSSMSAVVDSAGERIPQHLHKLDDDEDG